MRLKDIPGRLTLASYAHQFEGRFIYADMDANRHVNNGALGRYIEEGRSSVIQQIFGTDMMLNPPENQQILLAGITIEYLAQVAYPGTMIMATAISRIGNSSWEMASAGFQNGVCCVVAATTMVKAYEGKAAVLNEIERSALERFAFTG